MNKVSKFFLGPERGALSKIEKPYLNGLRIATMGGVIAFLGAAIVALGIEVFGKVVVVSGIITGFLGIVYHFILMFIFFCSKKAIK